MAYKWRLVKTKTVSNLPSTSAFFDRCNHMTPTQTKALCFGMFRGNHSNNCHSFKHQVSSPQKNQRFATRKTLWRENWQQNQLSNGNKTLTFHCAGWFIGILTIECLIEIPYVPLSRTSSPIYWLLTRAPTGHCSKLSFFENLGTYGIICEGEECFCINTIPSMGLVYLPACTIMYDKLNQR